jgi:hypothetical protein
VTGPPVSGYKAWYDASQITGLSHGASVNTWPDESGNGNDLVHGSFSAPTYYSTGALLPLSGLPVVLFSGSQALACNPLSETLPITVFAVGRATTSPGSSVYVLWSLGNIAGKEHQFLTLSSAWCLYESGYSGVSGGSTDANDHIWTVQSNGGSSLMRIDGTQVATGGVSSGTSPEFLLGTNSSGAAPWPGIFAEVIVYDSALSTDQMASIEAYLYAKWLAVPRTNLVGAGSTGSRGAGTLSAPGGPRHLVGHGCSRSVGLATVIAPPPEPSGTFDGLMLALDPDLWWKLNESSGSTVTDYSGHGHPGTYVGTVTKGQSPPGSMPSSDKGVLFDGSTGGITSSYPIAPTGDFSFVFWYKGVASSWAPFLLGTNDVYNNHSGVDFVVGDLAGTYTLQAGIEFSDGEQGLPITVPNDSNWHMVALVRHGNRVGLLLDDNGEAWTSLSDTGTFIPSGNNLQVAKPFGADSYYGGSISQIAYFSKALTGQQVSALYQLGIKGPFDQAVIASDPAVWWKGAVGTGGDSGETWDQSLGPDVAGYYDTLNAEWTLGTGASDYYHASYGAGSSVVPTQPGEPSATFTLPTGAFFGNFRDNDTPPYGWLADNPVGGLSSAFSLMAAFNGTAGLGGHPLTGALGVAYTGGWNYPVACPGAQLAFDASGHIGVQMGWGATWVASVFSTVAANDGNDHLAFLVVSIDSSGNWHADVWLDGNKVLSNVTWTGGGALTLQVLSAGGFTGSAGHFTLWETALSPTTIATLTTAGGFVPSANLIGSGRTSSAGRGVLGANPLPAHLVGHGLTGSVGRVVGPVVLSGGGETGSAGTGRLLLTDHLSGEGTTGSTGLGALTLRMHAVGAGSSSSIGVGQFVDAAVFESTAATASIGGGRFTETLSLVGAGASASSGSAHLSVAIPLTGSAETASVGSGFITLAPVGSGQSSSIGAGQVVPTTPFIGSGQSSSFGWATTSLGLPLTSTAASSSIGAGSLVATVPLTSASSTDSSGAATLSLGLHLVGRGVTSTVGSAIASLAIPLAGAGLSSSAASGTIGVAIPLLAVGESSSVGVFTLSVATPLAGMAVSSSLGSAQLTVAGAFVGSAATGSDGSGSFLAVVPLVGSGLSGSAAEATVSVADEFVGAGESGSLGFGERLIIEWLVGAGTSASKGLGSLALYVIERPGSSGLETHVVSGVGLAPALVADVGLETATVASVGGMVVP